MITPRTIRVSVILALVLTLFASVSVVSAQTVPATLGGSVTVRDNQALSDSVVISLSGVTTPASGTAYEGWLVSQNGLTKLSTGALSVSKGNISATYISPAGENLLANFNQFLITVEPVPDSNSGPSGEVAYSDFLEPASFSHVGHLLSAFSANPDGKGILVGLRQQVDVALSHAKLAKSATTFADKQSHSRHVINVLEGSAGDNYDVSFGDPGDGRGVLVYAADAIAHAGLAKDGAPDNTTVKTNADGVIAAANNVIAWATAARNNAKTISDSSTDDVLVSVNLSNTISNLTKAQAGVDSDGDDVVEAIDGEGGSRVAYSAGQDIALLDLFEGEVNAPVVGDTFLPMLMLMALATGLVLIGTGGTLLVRRRQPERY